MGVMVSQVIGRVGAIRSRLERGQRPDLAPDDVAGTTLLCLACGHRAAVPAHTSVLSLPRTRCSRCGVRGRASLQHNGLPVLWGGNDPRRRPPQPRSKAGRFKPGVNRYA